MIRKMNTFTGRVAKKAAAAFLFAVLGLGGAAAEDFRNIAVVKFDYYFDNAFRLEVEDVLLARFSPAFSIQAKVARYDIPGLFQHVFALGPIFNFSENVYLDALYGLGIDSQVRLEHRAELNLHYESERVVFGIGARGSYAPDTAYYFVIPTIEGKITLAEWLAVFGKAFLSWDSLSVLSGSFWAELYWLVSGAVTIRTGGTVSWSGAFGYSLLAGIEIRFSPTVLLKYHFQFLSNATDYSGTPAGAYGIQNGLFFDVKF